MDTVLAEILNSKFDFRLRGRPYETDREHLADLQSLISLYLTILASFKSAAQEAGESADGENYPGVRYTPSEASARVADFPVGEPLLEPDLRAMLTLAHRHIQSRLRHTDNPLRMERLRRLCSSDFTVLCVLCAMCCGLDRGFEELFVALHGQEELRCPTTGAADALYRIATGWHGPPAALPPEDEMLFFESDSERRPPFARPLILRQGIWAYLAGNDHPTGLLRLGTALNGTAAQEDAVGLEKPFAACDAILADAGSYPAPRLIILTGPAGSGKRTTLRMLAKDRDAPFLLLRLESIARPVDRERLAAELQARCLLLGEILCIDPGESEEQELLISLLSRLSPCQPTIFLLMEHLRRNLAPEGYLVHRIDYALPGLEQSVAYWQMFAARCGCGSSGIMWHEIAAKYTLSPGRIQAALENVLAISRTSGQPLDSAMIDKAALLGNTGNLSEIADGIPTVYTWDDLVLGDLHKGMLRDVCNRIKYRHVVENKWGFQRRSPYGNGISLLLYGPPGTGKTMSAQVVAGELGLPLYRINLAQMISKYIGETAKNLDAVFREARSSNVILFFDEADALFAKRTDVKNSNDRHANSESAYLLQKIEEYAGISILATNLAQNFDEAFRRRILYMINIPLPGADERLRLWRAYMGGDAPLADDVDFPLLARELELSGSVIKAAALQAAYFAAAEDTLIGMAQIVRAVRLELNKLGKSEPHFMSQYQ